ncbi:MAG: DUF721 domain-containing protein [Flavobacteriaceae bacterium]|nr:DUF721 domain-containing protein [Flavobacteriaceae bacterium]
MKRQHESKKIGTILKEMIEGKPLERGIDSVRIREVWEEQMGASILAYTEEIVLKNSTLFVKLSSAVLREELGYGKEKIKNLLNESLDKEVVKKIVFR